MKQIFELKGRRLSEHRTARTLGISRKTVANYLAPKERQSTEALPNSASIEMNRIRSKLSFAVGSEPFLQLPTGFALPNAKQTCQQMHLRSACPLTAPLVTSTGA